MQKESQARFSLPVPYDDYVVIYDFTCECSETKELKQFYVWEKIDYDATGNGGHLFITLRIHKLNQPVQHQSQFVLSAHSNQSLKLSSQPLTFDPHSPRQNHIQPQKSGRYLTSQLSKLISKN